MTGEWEYVKIEIYIFRNAEDAQYCYDAAMKELDREAANGQDISHWRGTKIGNAIITSTCAEWYEFVMQRL